MNCAGRLFLRRLPHPLLGPRLSACRTDCLWAWQHQQQHLQRQRLQQRSVQYTCGALAAQQASASPALPPAASPTVTSGGPAPPLAPVSFDYTTLVAATAELQAWVPAKVEAVVQQEAGTALRLRTVADSGWLHLCYHSRYAHVGIGTAPPRGAAAELFTFGAQLQAALRGLVLTAVLVPTPFERVLKLVFAPRPGDPPTCQVVFECMNRYSNLLLLDPNDTVLAAAHQVGQRMSSVRHVQVGGRWELPPPAGGVDPGSCSSLEQWREVLCRLAEAAPPERPATIAQVAVRGFRGVSPQLARDLALAAGVGHDSRPADLDSMQWQRLYAAWQSWLDRLASGRFAASSCPQTGGFSLLGTQPQQVPCLLPFLHQYYSAPQEGEAFGGLKQQLCRVVAAAITRLHKKVAALQQQGGEGDRHLGTQRQADMIMGNVYRISPGAAWVEVEDWDSGELVRLPLDPRKTAVEAAEALYKQARKQRRAVLQVAPLLAAARQELAYLAEVEVMLQQLEGGAHLAALQEVQAELVAGRYMKAPPDAALAGKAAAKARKTSQRAQKRSGGGGGGNGSASGGSRDFRRYESPSGFAVLVGRNSRQNDELSNRMAQPGEVWMHARGVPGAHLLMRVPAGRSASEADMRFAADLAAWFSKARSEGKVDVTVCDPKHLSKPTGAKPGQVLVKKESVVVGRPDQSAAAQQGELD
ncbi:hypothetical protein D9Q98_001707 [Chlorella vulgaris]|uniref:NFACT RNA-binding domain-containing protein n=1 Tax=Chlorella vulgaris TaxID=3077 RepID=A0A9D4TV31_CHLVU|nr:hypothetical protein D9Q98_001707 [Chlorella vulgaris]